MLRFVLLWFPIVFLATANGAFREFVLRKSLAELPAHQISTVMLLCIFTAYTWFALGRWRPASASQALLVGVVWTSMTLVFEFGFGHFVGGHTWERLLSEYDLPAGRLWVLVPVWVTIAPWAIFRLRQRGG